MAWNITQPSNGTVKLVPQGGGSEAKEVIVEFAPKVFVAIGRGSTDKDITYLAMKNADGELCYIYPNAAQDGIVVSATKP